MTSRRTSQPRWNTLSIILVLAIGLLVFESLIHLTPAGHKLVLLVIILLTYGLFGLWIKSNAREIEELTAADVHPREIWRSTRLEWNNGKEGTPDGIDRLEDERSFDTLRV